MKIIRLTLLFLFIATNSWASYTVDFSSASGVPSTSATKFQINGVQVGTSIGGTSIGSSAYNLVFSWSYTLHALQISSFATESSNCTASVTVNVNDALTGSAISGASVVIDESSATTDSSGQATFSSLTIPGTASSGSDSLSNVQVTVSASGYVPSSNRVALTCSGSETTSISLLSSTSTSVTSGDIKFVLAWGANPRDLDSHLTGPTTTSSTFHVYYASKNRTGSSGSYTASDSTIPAFLDIDDTSSYGPETTTIVKGSAFTAGTYKFSVRHYSGSSDIPNSGASVKVYQGTTLLRTFYPPTSSTTISSGQYWSVCNLTISSSGSVSITEVGTYGSTYASRSIPIQTRIGPVYPEAPSTFMNLPPKQ